MRSWRTGLGAVAGALLGALLLMAGLGALLPREHVAQVSLDLPAPPEEVYAKIRAIERAPSWRTGITAVELLPPDADGRPRYRERGDNDLAFTIDEEIPGQRLVTRIAEPGPFGGRWIYALAPQEDGTRLTITEEGFVDNVILRFLAARVVGYDATLKGYAADLTRAMHTAP